MTRLLSVARLTCAATLLAGTATVSYGQSPCFETNLGAALGALDDWVSPPMPLGFNFPFNGGTTNTVDISSNGFVWLNSGTGTGNRCCNGVEGTFLVDPACIAPLWTDLTPAASAGGGPGEVYFNTFAAPPRAVITWSQVREFGQATHFDIQLQLEPNGVITVVYGIQVAIVGHSAIVGITEGGGAAPHPVDLSGFPAPSATPTIYQYFAAGTYDLAGRTMRYAPLGGGYLPFTDPGCSAARAQRFGTGCPIPPTFYEQFTAAGSNDLSGFGLRLSLNLGGGYDVTPCVGCFNPNFSNNLGSADDQLFSAMPLGFTIAVPGLGTTSTIDIDSNGRAGVGLAGSDYTESVAEFLAETLWSVCWDDFNPSAGGGLYFDTAPGLALVTWDQVPQYPAVGSNTFQVQFHANGDVVYAWQQVSDDALVGYAPGTSALDPGSIDLTARVPFSVSGSGAPMGLGPSAATPRPLLGQPFGIEISDVPSPVAGGTLLLGTSQLQFDLSSIGMIACTLYCTANWSLGIPVASPTTVLPLGTVPRDPHLIGSELFLQVAAVAPGANPAGLVLSNGLDLAFHTF